MEQDNIVCIDISELKNRTPPKINHRDSYYGRIEEYSLDGTYISTWRSSAEIADHYGISITPIYNCIRGCILKVNKIGRIFLREGSSIEERLAEIAKSEENPSSKPCKIAVEEYDINGKFIKAYSSLTQTDMLPASVRKICRGEVLCSRHNRIFLFQGASIQQRLEQIKQQKYNKAMPDSIDEYTMKGELSKHWKNAADISENYGFPVHKILDSCFGDINSYKGKIFLFSRDNIRKRLKTIKSKNNE